MALPDLLRASGASAGEVETRKDGEEETQHAERRDDLRASPRGKSDGINTS